MPSPPISKMNFSTEAFWVHMHDLSIRCMTEEMGREIGKRIGKVIKFDLVQNGYGWGKALRVLIEVELQKPISRDRTINLLGNKHWVPLTFEKLPRIYFQCGRIVHGESNCKEGRGTTNGSSGHYGPWLKEAVGNKAYRKNSNFGFQTNNSTKEFNLGRDRKDMVEQP